MNQREAVAVVALFQGAWGHVEVNERMMVVWNDVLREVPAEEGRELARRLVRESPHFPAPSAFYAAWKAQRRHAALVANYAKMALPSGEYPTPAEDALGRVAELRRALAERCPVHGRLEPDDPVPDCPRCRAVVGAGR